MLVPLKKKKKLKFNTDKFLLVVLLYIYFLKKKTKARQTQVVRQINSNLSVMSDVIIFYVSFLIKVISIYLIVWFD